MCFGVIDFLSELKKCGVCGYRGIASAFVRGEGVEAEKVKCPTCGSEQTKVTARSNTPEVDDIIQKLFSVPGYKRTRRSKPNRLSYLFTDKRKDRNA